MNCLVFDLDDTLVPSSMIYEECYSELGLDLRLLCEAKKRVKQAFGDVKSTSSHSRFLYFKAYLELADEFSSSKLIALNSQYEQLLFNKLQAYISQSSVQKILKTLSESHFLALLTNESTRTQILKLNSIDPSGQIFKMIVTSEEAGAEKPNMSVFGLLKSRMEMKLKIKNYTMIGDSYLSDILPAESLGWRAIQMIGHLDDQSCHSVKIKSLEELELVI